MKAALTGLGLALAAAVSQAAPLCETRVVIEPRTAFVGQQVLYRLTILRQLEVSSVRFEDELSFPSFRVEWLPGQTLDPAIRDVGEHALVVEERRALFPTRAGVLAIPAARLECRSGSAVALAEVPATAIEVREPPTDRALVGRVAAKAFLARDRIALGESALLTVTLRSEANLWDAASPLGAGVAIDGVDVHPRVSETTRTPGRRLALERTFAYDLVPRRAGTHVIPALRVAWLDPETGRDAVEETPPLRLEVVAAAPLAAESRVPPPKRIAPARSRGPLWIGALLVLGVGLALVARRSRGRLTPQRAAAPHLADAVAAKARGDRGGERAALAAALRAALAVRRPAARALAAEELVAQTEGAERDAADALLALDRARFTPSDAPPSLDVADVQALVASLRSRE